MRICLLIGLAFAGLALWSQTSLAQEPTPTQQWPRCAAGMPGQDGGRTIAADTNIGTLVTLPPGSYHLLVMPPASPDFAICHIETQSVVTIARTTCLETSRSSATTSAANAVLDQIVASCTVPDEPPPQPHCHYDTYVSGGGELTLSLADITVELPDGEFIIADGIRGPNTVSVCKPQNNLVSIDYAVVLGSDCSRVEAQSFTSDGAAAIEAIADSCVGQIGAPTVMPPVAIQPPDTGDAGLQTEP